MARTTKGGEGVAPAKKPAVKKATSRTKKATTAAVEPVSAMEPVAVVSVEPVNVEEKIRVRAYELFLQRNGNYGSPEQDWYQAESEIRTKIA